MEHELGYTKLKIRVGRDSTLGGVDDDFKTEIEINDILRVEGCDGPINHKFNIKNLPQATPVVLFRKNVANDKIPYCTEDIVVDIASSLGLTSRAPESVVWSIYSMYASSTSLKKDIEDDVLDKAEDELSFRLTPSQVKSLTGRDVTFKATVTNFLGLSSSNTTEIEFENSKEIILTDLEDIYFVSVMEDFKLTPRVRIPYCPGSS